MRKILTSISSLSLLPIVATAVYAQGSAAGAGASNTTGSTSQVLDCSKTDQFQPLCNLSGGNLGTVIGQVLVFIFVIAIIIALFYLIYGGIKWLTSGGDKTAVEGARNHITSAIIGLVIIFLSFFILNLILEFFLHTDLTHINIPMLQ